MGRTSSLSALPDRQLLLAIAAELGVDPSLVEKDWHAVLIEALRNTADWTIREEDIQVRNASRTFQCEIAYPFVFDQSPILRRRISLDVTFGVPAVSPEERPVRSFVAEARRDPPEVPSIACMAPVEIAAEKLSALTWRVLTRRRGIGNDDPAPGRHSPPKAGGSAYG